MTWKGNQALHIDIIKMKSQWSNGYNQHSSWPMAISNSCCHLWVHGSLTIMLSIFALSMPGHYVKTENTSSTKLEAYSILHCQRTKPVPQM